VISDFATPDAAAPSAPSKIGAFKKRAVGGKKRAAAKDLLSMLEDDPDVEGS
jgi:hypothetical protein